ncbi:MAG: hypothetical protein HZA52_03390 [Planctomycetes bacterium]|nr:hypothetical protein [Planctomycetota bacterium]
MQACDDARQHSLREFLDRATIPTMTFARNFLTGMLIAACSSCVDTRLSENGRVGAARLDDATMASIAAHMTSRDLAAIPYPWIGLEGRLLEQDKQLQLIGYGSLLSAKSAARTFSVATVEQSYPVVAAGLYRVFQYVMHRTSPEQAGVDNGTALNVRWTGKADDLINGRVFSVPVAAIDALRRREVGYDLIPVPFVPWSHPNAEPAFAYVLSCTRPEFEGRQLLSDTSLPNSEYYAMCRAAAESVSDEFLSFYLSTTHVAGGLAAKAWEVGR